MIFTHTFEYFLLNTEASVYSTFGVIVDATFYSIFWGLSTRLFLQCSHFNVLTRMNPPHLQSHYPTLILNAIISHLILTLDPAHISALQTRLQAAAVIDRACSLARTGE